jgi:hypothetical protein
VTSYAPVAQRVAQLMSQMTLADEISLGADGPAVAGLGVNVTVSG